MLPGRIPFLAAGLNGRRPPFAGNDFGKAGVIPQTSGPRREQALRSRAIPGGLGEAGADVAAREPDVAQLAIGKLAQNGELCLMFALRDDSGDRVVDDAEKPARKEPDRSSKRKRRRRKVGRTVPQAHGRFILLKRVKLPFPACTMHANGLQDFQIGTIFPSDKLGMSVRIRAMRAHASLLDCTEPFRTRTRARERRTPGPQAA